MGCSGSSSETWKTGCMRVVEGRRKVKGMGCEPKVQLAEVCEGIPCLVKAWVMNMSATSTAVTVSVIGMKIPSFERWSRTTKMAARPMDNVNCQ